MIRFNREDYEMGSQYADLCASTTGPLGALCRSMLAFGWRTMETAPKSTSTPVTMGADKGAHVQGVYILGYMPDMALEPAACVEVIWWEPNEKDGKGCWVSNTETEVNPLLWTYIPFLPRSTMA